MRKLVIAFLCFGVFQATSLYAASKVVTLRLPPSIRTGSVLAVSKTGTASTTPVTGSALRVTLPGTSAKLYVLNSDRHVSQQIVAKTCRTRGGSYSCDTTGTVVITEFRAGANLGRLKPARSTGALIATIAKDAYRKSLVTASTAQATRFIPVGIATNGLNKGGHVLVQGPIGIRATSDDADSDGLVNALDSDDDGDGILDNYDDSSSSSGSSSFNVFSNFKLSIDQSLNLHATGLSRDRIDRAMQNVQTLAIQVAGGTSDTVELDCGTLGYCSSGGTGTGLASNQPFPGTSGGTFDSDGDGLGTIVRGGTGDFQLKTGATSRTIAAGDTLVERVSSSGTETALPGIINFIFLSTPALKSVSVNGGAAETINYASTPIKGSQQNCFAAPATGAVTLAIVGWRPQRSGVTDAGEAEYVDIGKSLITADIPNGACTSGGSCAPQGPGNCAGSAYSTTDSNLEVSANGLNDKKADSDADSTNTFSFTLDLTGCLSSAPSGAVSWSAGQTISVDVQFKSNDGDNAAQKFCVTRAAS